MERALLARSRGELAPAPDDGLIEAFVDYLDRKPSTAKAYLKALRMYARWCDENGINNPTRNDVRAYRDSLAERGLTATTQRTYMQAVRALHKWVSWNFGFEDVAVNLHGAKVRSDVHLRDALSPEDVQSVLAHIDRSTEQGLRTYVICLLAAVDGLRTVEIVRADVRDLQTINGKRYLSIQPKGHDSKDVLRRLTPRVSEAVDEYMKARKDRWDGASPLFVSTSNRNPGGRMTTTSVSGSIKSAMRSAGYDSPRLTAHSLRHSAATAAIESGLELREVQKLMGHVNPATTEVYVHDRDERRIEDAGRRRVEAHLLGDDGTETIRNRIARSLAAIEDADKLKAISKFIEQLEE